MSIGHIYLIDQPSENNKKLIVYLQSNLAKIVSKNNREFTFQFTIATQQNSAQLKAKGLVHFPVMVVTTKNTPEKNIAGVGAIESYLNALMNGGPEKNSFKSAKSDEDAIELFQREALGPITRNAQGQLQVANDQEDTDEDQFTKTLQTKLVQALDNRKAINPSFGKGAPKQPDNEFTTQLQSRQKNNTQKAARQDNLVSARGGNSTRANQSTNLKLGEEDTMLAQFLANQEITPM